MVRVHPLVGAAGDVLGVLKAVADLNPTFMSVDEKAEALLALSTAQALLAETLRFPPDRRGIDNED